MRRLGYYLAGVLALPGAASAQIAAPVQYDAVSTPAPVDSKGVAHDVAILSDRSDRITVKVMIGGQGPYNFLVDTGADHTVIGSHIAGSLNLEPAARVQLFTVAGSQKVNTASVGKMQFSNKTLENVNAAILERSNLGADGVLGIDSLRSERVTFDFRKGLMTIVPSSKAETRVPGRDTVVVTGKLRAGRLVLTQARAANKPVNVVIDTGSDALGKLQIGSVVTEVNFQPVSSPEQAIAAAEAAKRANKPVLLQVWGGDEVSFVSVRAR